MKWVEAVTGVHQWGSVTATYWAGALYEAGHIIRRIYWVVFA